MQRYSCSRFVLLQYEIEYVFKKCIKVAKLSKNLQLLVELLVMDQLKIQNWSSFPSSTCSRRTFRLASQ